MRSSDAAVRLDKSQSRAADSGMKAMIPIGRPFLDFVLSALADAGFTEACLVVGPEHTAIREYYASPARRIKISFAIQEQPIGTANAVLAAQSFTGDESFVVLNSDNYYPVEVFCALRTLAEPGLPAFERKALLRESNIPRERILGYALLKMDRAGYLEQIIEKPSEMPTRITDNGGVFISMNCWRFAPDIFQACREVPRSARGEFELPEAVQFGLSSLGLHFKTIPFHSGVLDLSYRTDIAEVARRLAGIRVEL